MSVIWSGVTEEGAVVPVQVTAEGKVVAVGDGPEGDYLKLTGGNLTGDLTLGTDKITLNASDGSAILKGAVTMLDGLAETGFTSNPGIYINNNGGTSDPLNSAILSRDSTVNTTFEVKSNGSITAAGSASFEGKVTAGTPNTSLDTNGVVFQPNGVIRAQRAAAFSAPGNSLLSGYSGTTEVVRLSADGSALFAGGKCGFTSAGEIFFTSRNSRYKLLVQGELVVAEPYTRQMELKERAEQFIAEKKETKPSELEPEPEPEVTPDNDNA